MVSPSLIWTFELTASTNPKQSSTWHRPGNMGSVIEKRVRDLVVVRVCLRERPGSGQERETGATQHVLHHTPQ